MCLHLPGNLDIPFIVDNWEIIEIQSTLHIAIAPPDILAAVLTTLDSDEMRCLICNFYFASPAQGFNHFITQKYLTIVEVDILGNP